MKYCIKFENHEIFAVEYQSAMVAAIALAKQYIKVQVWRGSELVWDYNNA